MNTKRHTYSSFVFALFYYEHEQHTSPNYCPCEVKHGMPPEPTFHKEDLSLAGRLLSVALIFCSDNKWSSRNVISSGHSLFNDFSTPKRHLYLLVLVCVQGCPHNFLQGLHPQGKGRRFQHRQPFFQCRDMTGKISRV